MLVIIKCYLLKRYQPDVYVKIIAEAISTLCASGHTDDGDVCIRFGLITDSTDIEELVILVTSTGREVEESSKVGQFESFSECDSTQPS